MLKRTILLLVFCSLFINNVKPAIPFYFESENFVQDDEFFYHTVERGQTVYGIATMYHVSKEDIFRLNPGSESVIRAGYKLKVPQTSGSYIYHTIQPQETLYGVSKKYEMKGEDIVAVNPGLSVGTFQIGKIIRIPVNRVTSPVQGGNEMLNKMRTNSLLTQSAPLLSISPIRIALILPFDAKGKGERRMVEYYEGFLLAVKEMKSRGISVALQVYDAANATQLSAVLEKPELQNVHLIIGGSQEQIKQIARFSADRNIPYVIPFTSESDEPFYNPRVLQVNTPQSYLYSKASAAFASRYGRDRIFLVKDNTEKPNKIDFINALKTDFQAQNIQYSEIAPDRISYDEFLQEVDFGRRNVFVPADDSRQTLEMMISQLKKFSDQHPDYSISLFGYTRWQIDGQKTLADDFARLNTTFFSGFFTNPVADDVQTFYKDFYRWYSRTPANAFPRYGILGYDTGMFFITALDRFGASFENSVADFRYDGIQTCFRFERVNNWGGFINTGLYFVDYGSDFTVTKNTID